MVNVSKTNITAQVSENKVTATVTSGVGASGASSWGDISGKPETFPPSTHQHVAADITDFTTAVVAAAPPTTNASLLVSGTLPDARLSSNIARTSDVSAAVAALVNSAPATLDTLAEISAALNNDASFAVTVTNSLATKAPINNPTFTGTVGGITKAMVGLGNVDNTSDANKPISTAMQTALEGKAAASHSHGSLTSDGKIGTGTDSGQIVVTGAGGVLTTTATISASSVSGLFSGAYADLTGKPTLFDGSYTSLTNVPSTFTPASHNQAWSTITSTPTTLSGYGITDGVATSDARLSDTRTPTDGSVTDAKVTSGGLSTSSLNWSAIQDWAPNTSYTKGDLVNYLGVAYRRSSSGVSGSVFSSTNWQQITPSTGSTGSTLCVGNDQRLVSDGNKGDITVGSGNTSWTINAGAVVTADIADGAVTNAKVTSITASKISDFASAVASASPEEVVEYQTTANFPASGNSSLLYIATDPSRAYRWTGEQYVEVGPASTFVQAHTHSASDITSGVLATARLGSGTANSTTFLRGDQTYAAPPVTSVDGATGAVTTTKAAVFEFTRSSKPASATGSNGSYTWSLPAGAKFIEVFCLGGGGGGGSGRRGAAGTARFGGGGGAGGNATTATVDAAVITTALTIAVGPAGVGGAAATADDTNGNNGTAGTFSSVTFNGSQMIRGVSGGAGSGGTAAAGTGGGVNNTDQRTFAASAGGSSSVSANGGSTFPATGNAGMGGPSGGGISTSNVAYSGGQQWNPPSLAGVINSGATNVFGGAASTTAEGASGAAGVSYGYGGAGGGASANGFNSGAGGNGGDGYVRITVWY